MLEHALECIEKELPWVDDTRILLGPFADAAMVKEPLLQKNLVIPGHAVTSTSGLAKEIYRKFSRAPLLRPLSVFDQADALQALAKHSVISERLPQIAKNLRVRSFARKMSRFLSDVDQFYRNENEFDLLVEYFAEKNAEKAELLQAVRLIWNSGQMVPWSDGYHVRKAIDALQSRKTKPPSRVFLFGFSSEMSPLEEAFINILRETCTVEEISPRANATRSRVLFWQPHTVFDELDFLKEHLLKIREQTKWSDVAIFIPSSDDNYRSLVQANLNAWNVPVSGQGVRKPWTDDANAVWWFEALRTVALGMRKDDVQNLLAFDSGAGAVFGKAYRFQIESGSANWKKLQDEKTIQWLVAGLGHFAKAMRPIEFLAAALKFSEKVERDSVLVEFAQHLVRDREYLVESWGRAGKYLLLFEEFLEDRARRKVEKSVDGVQLVTHEKWLPFRTTHAFVLGAGFIKNRALNTDTWEFNSLEVRSAWAKIHSEGVWANNVAYDPVLRDSFFQSKELVVSSTDYGISGGPQAHGVFFKTLREELKVEISKKGGSERIGWQTEVSDLNPNPQFAVRDLPHVTSLSVSAFETFLKCPFIYFARNVAKWKEPEELGLEADARARGKVLHSVLEILIRHEIESSTPLDFDSAAKKIPGLVAEHIQAHGLPGLFPHPALLAKNRVLLQQTALRWLEWEFENRKKHPTLKPLAVEERIEVEFFESSPHAIRLHGVVDRVDSDGRQSVIFDYKSGSVPYGGKQLLAGHGVQLFGYARAIQKSRGLEPAAAIYLRLARKIESTKGFFVKAFSGSLHPAKGNNGGLIKTSFQDALEGVLPRWKAAIEKLKSGNFSADPYDSKICARCKFRNICGHKISEEVPENA